MNCPVCKLGTGFYYWPNAVPDGPTQAFPIPLYQRSYKGSEEYISPRCLSCYNKKEGKMSHKKDRERARKGHVFRDGKLVPKKEVEKPAPEDTDNLLNAMERLTKRMRR